MKVPAGYPTGSAELKGTTGCAAGDGMTVPDGYPIVSAEQRAKIERTAQGILDARAAYPDCSLADLYDSLTMPQELRRAHRANDAAVLEAYGFPPAAPEPELVSRLFGLYRLLTAGARASRQAR